MRDQRSCKNFCPQIRQFIHFRCRCEKLFEDESHKTKCGIRSIFPVGYKESLGLAGKENHRFTWHPSRLFPNMSRFCANPILDIFSRLGRNRRRVPTIHHSYGNLLAKATKAIVTNIGLWHDAMSVTLLGRLDMMLFRNRARSSRARMIIQPVHNGQLHATNHPHQICSHTFSVNRWAYSASGSSKSTNSRISPG